MEFIVATNPLSLDDVFEQSADHVYSFVLNRVGNPLLAEDLTSETFSAASRQFAKGRGTEVTLPWLLTVAQRRLIDHWRSETTRERKLIRLQNEAITAPTELESSATAVDEALASLPDRYRAALTLRYLDDLAVSEVATALDVTYKAAESTLSRARAAFAAAYEAQR